MITEAVNEQFCCLLYLAILLKSKHPLFLEVGGGEEGGLECSGMGCCVYFSLVCTTIGVLVMTPLKFGTHVNANVLGKGAEVM